MGLLFDFANKGIASERPADGFGSAQASEGRPIGGLIEEGGEVRDPGQDGGDVGYAVILSGEMGVDARPRPVLRPLDLVGTHRVLCDIADGGFQVGLVHDYGAEAALPEMAGALKAGMDMAGITAMHRGERATKTVFVRRHQDQVDMVGHQHPRPYRNTGGTARFCQQGAIERVIVVAKEYLRTAVAALGDVVRQAGNDEAGETAHAAVSQRRWRESIKCTVTVIQ